MNNKRVVLICDDDAAYLAKLQAELQPEGFDVDILNNASKLLQMATQKNPSVLIVNPDMSGFDAASVCNQLQTKHNIRVILMLHPNSTHRAQIGDCAADDVVTKPVEVPNLTNLISKHIVLGG